MAARKHQPRSVPPAHGAEATAPPLPGWVVPAAYLVITLILFRKFVISDAMLYGVDTLSLGYMARAFFAEVVQELGTFPLWNPRLLGGTPFIDSLAGGESLYPTSLLMFVLDPYRALGWKLVIHIFLAGVLMYAWLRTVNTSRAASFVGGLAYLLAPYMVTLVYPGHDGKIFVTALTPLLFLLAERSLAGPGLLYFALLALSIGLVILTTHFQMAYFLFAALGVYYLVRAIQVWRQGDAPRARRRFLMFVVAALVGGAVSAVQLVPAVRYVTEFSRRTATTTEASAREGVEYASSWSLHPEELVSLVVPEFVGNNAGGAEWTTNTYWGRNPFKLNHEYVGIVVLLLAGFAFVDERRRRLGWLLLGIGAVALLFSLGANTPIWRIFYEVVPGIRLFRAPAMVIFLFGFAATTLAAWGLDEALGWAAGKGTDRAERGVRYLWIATGVLFLLTLLANTGLLTGFWTAAIYDELAGAKAQALEAARPFITRGFFIATLLAGATAGLLHLLRKGAIGASAATAGIALLVFVDLFRVDDPFVQVIDFSLFATPSASTQFLLERQSVEPPFRVLSMVSGAQDVHPAMFGLELAGGHHPNDLGRYRELIGMVGSGLPENLLRNTELLRLLNIRYIVWPVAQLGGIQGQEPVYVETSFRGQPVTAVYEFPALPRAYLVGEAAVVPDDAAVEFMLNPAYDPARQAVLPEPAPIELSGGTVEGQVVWLERGVNRQVARVTSSGPALLVLSENWYPAWRAQVDGAEVPLLRANYTLRAVPIPAGEHVVEVWYESELLQTTLIVSIIASVLALAAVAAVLFRRRRIGTTAHGP